MTSSERACRYLKKLRGFRAGTAALHDRIRDLETQLEDLKARNRELEAELKRERPVKPPPKPSAEPPRSHQSGQGTNGCDDLHAKGLPDAYEQASRALDDTREIRDGPLVKAGRKVVGMPLHSGNPGDLSEMRGTARANGCGGRTALVRGISDRDKKMSNDQ